VIDRNSCEEVWGFAWNVSAHARQRLIVAGVDLASPAGHWGALQKAGGGRPITRGDEVLCISGAIDYASFRQELSSSLQVIIRLRSAEVASSPGASSAGSPSPHRAGSLDDRSPDSVFSPISVRTALARRRAAGGLGVGQFDRVSPTSRGLDGPRYPSPPFPAPLLPTETTPSIASPPSPSTPIPIPSDQRSASSVVQRPTLASPSGSQSPENNNLHGCSVKNTFIEVKMDDFADSDDDSWAKCKQSRLMQSDPTPMIGIAASLGLTASPYTPGCLAGVNLAQSITSNASAGGSASSQQLDSSGTFTSMKSNSGGNNLHSLLSSVHGLSTPEFLSSFAMQSQGMANMDLPAPLEDPAEDSAVMSASAQEAAGAASSSGSVSPSTVLVASSSPARFAPPPPAPLSPAPAAVLMQAPPPYPPPASDAAVPSGAGSATSGSTAGGGVQDPPPSSWKPNLRGPAVDSAPASPAPAASAYGNTGVGISDFTEMFLATKPAVSCAPAASSAARAPNFPPPPPTVAPMVDFVAATSSAGPCVLPPSSPPGAVALAPPRAAAAAAATAAMAAAWRQEAGREMAEQSGGESEGSDDSGEDGAGGGKHRKPTRRGGRRARHRKLAALARIQDGPAGLPAEDSGEQLDDAAHMREPSPPVSGGDTSPQKEPVRRGGRPAKKSGRAAAAVAASAAPVAEHHGTGQGYADGAVAAGISGSWAVSVMATDVHLQIGGILHLDGDTRGAPVSLQSEHMQGADVIGKRVLIQGLVRAPEFNGQWGRVESYDPAMQRYLVSVVLGAEGDPPVNAMLRRENLVVPTTVKLQFEDAAQAMQPPPQASFDGASSSTAATQPRIPPPPAVSAHLAGAPWCTEPAFVPFPTSSALPLNSRLGIDGGIPPPPLHDAVSLHTSPDRHLPGNSAIAEATAAMLAAGFMPSMPGPAADFEDSCAGLLLQGSWAGGLIGVESSAAATSSMTMPLPSGFGGRLLPAQLGSALDFEDSVAGSFSGATPMPSPGGAGEEMGPLASASGGADRARRANMSLYSLALEEPSARMGLDAVGPSADFEDSMVGDFASSAAAAAPAGEAPRTPQGGRKRAAGCGTPANAKSGSLLEFFPRGEAAGGED